MAGTYTRTGTYTNLTRLQLEALRRADDFVGNKALTIGDSGLPPEGVVGAGRDLNAEPYYTGQFSLLQDAFPITPPTQPGLGVSTGGITNQAYQGGFDASITISPGPTFGGNYSITFSVVHSMSNVTASGSMFEDTTGVLVPGQYLVFASQPTVYYEISGVSGSAVSISPNYSGTTNAATTAVATFPGTFSVMNGSQNVTASMDETWGLFAGQVLVFSTQQSTPYTVLEVSGTSIILATAYTGVTNAAAPASGTTVTVSNLTGFPGGPTGFGGIEALVGGNLTISGAADSGNNGSFQITGFPSTTSLTITNPNATTDSNNGAISWHVAAESPLWYGPQEIFNASFTLGGLTDGSATGTLQWTSAHGGFTAAGVANGDLLLVGTSYENPLNNQYAVGVIQSATDNVLTLSSVSNAYSNPGGPTVLNVDGNNYGYSIVRHNAVQLFAVPGSGPLGSEQTFLAVAPGSSLHSNLAPTLAQINADRVQNLVPSQYSTGDRADAVFAAPAPFTTLDQLGYRVVLYPDNGSQQPNLLAPIATLNPVIDPNIPSNAQRLTVDYKAGAVRFSCAPKTGGQIKVAGGANATTGRLNLYAVFWAIDQTFIQGASQSLYVPRNLAGEDTGPATVSWNGNTWVFTQNNPSTSGNGIISVGGPTNADNDGINTFDVPDGTSSIVKKLNTEFVLVCGDGNESYGDFNGSDALVQAIDFWQSLSSPPFNCTIHLKRGSYTTNSGFGQFTIGSAPGYSLTIVGDGKTNTTITQGSFNVHFMTLSEGCQLTLKNLSLLNTSPEYCELSFAGSLRFYECYFRGVIFSGGGTTPLQVSSGSVAPDMIICEDCEFDWTSSVTGAFSFTATTKNCIWRDCIFLMSSVTGFQFPAQAANTTCSYFTWEHCQFQVAGVSTSSGNPLGNQSFTGGVIGVSPSFFDLTLTLDHFLYEECTVSSTDTSSDSVILMHLFPLSYYNPNNGSFYNYNYRVHIGQVTIRGGTWSTGTRGNDFAPFFLMCSNPVVEDVKLLGGGTNWTGLSTSPGFQGNGAYSTQQMIALTGTVGGYAGAGNFFATIAASGNALFNTVGNDFGLITAGPTVTFSDLTATSVYPSFQAGMVGMSIVIEGCNTPANNGTFTILSASGTSCTFSNPSGTTDTNSGSISWSITNSTKSGMVVRNLSVQNMPQSSYSGDLCLVGPPLNGGPVEVDGVWVSNNSGTAGNKTPWSRIHIRPGASYAPVNGAGLGPVVGTYVTTTASLPTAVIHVATTSGFNPNGDTLLINDQLVTYTGTSGTTFTGCSGGTGTITANTTPVICATAAVVPGTNGSNGMFRNITWSATTNLATGNGGGGFVNSTGAGVSNQASSGIVSLGYMGDLQVENVRVIAPTVFMAARGFGQQFDVIQNVGVTCTDMWGTITLTPQRGRLILRNVLCENMGQDEFGFAGGVVVSGSQAVAESTSGMITLSDFFTIDACSLKVTSNFFNNEDGNNLEPVGIQVVPGWTARNGTDAHISAFASNTSTIVGLTNMTQADQDNYLIMSGSTHGGNNGIFLITEVLTPTSVEVLSVSGAIDAGPDQWAVANSLVTNWNIHDAVVLFNNIGSGLGFGNQETAGIQAFWTQSTAQGSLGSGNTSIGNVANCYVNMTTTASSFSGPSYPYVFISVDQSGGGQAPAINFMSNIGVVQDSAGTSPGSTWIAYYAGSTITAVPPGNLTRGFLTSFTTGQGDYSNGDLMIFNNGVLKTP